jgi:hypothetical protein
VKPLKDESYAIQRAYVPEHLPGYVRAVSGGKAYVAGPYVLYERQGHLVFIGYPLEGAFERSSAQRAVDEAVKEMHPRVISVIAPEGGLVAGGEMAESGSDNYFSLSVRGASIPQKTRTMIRRAGREVSVTVGRKWTGGHGRLVEAFLRSRRLDEGTRSIYEKAGDYVSSCPSALLFEAKAPDGRLAAFDVADFGSRTYAFYMFNFRSQDGAVPGASDLLLHAIVAAAREQGKQYVNLGLGINAGVRFFKEKWGAVPFLGYAYGRWTTGLRETPFDLFSRL